MPYHSYKDTVSGSTVARVRPHGEWCSWEVLAVWKARGALLPEPAASSVKHCCPQGAFWFQGGEQIPKMCILAQ